jgi:hypothetical protein
MPKLKADAEGGDQFDAAAALEQAKDRLRSQVDLVQPTVAPTSRRSTDRMSISLLREERVALEERAARLRFAGHRGIKPSRLARIAFRLLLETSDEQILQWAEQVENLETRRVKRA